MNRIANHTKWIERVPRRVVALLEMQTTELGRPRRQASARPPGVKPGEDEESDESVDRRKHCADRLRLFFFRGRPGQRFHRPVCGPEKKRKGRIDGRRESVVPNDPQAGASEIYGILAWQGELQRAQRGRRPRDAREQGSAASRKRHLATALFHPSGGAFWSAGTWREIAFYTANQCKHFGVWRGLHAPRVNWPRQIRAAYILVIDVIARPVMRP
jgi:hypothetical protein